MTRLINETEKRQNAYLEELNKHNKLLNEKLNDLRGAKDNLPTMSHLLKDFEKKIIVAKMLIITSIQQLSNCLSVVNSNNKLKQVIANSDAKIEELKSEIRKAKSVDVDANLNELANKQQSTLNKMCNSTDDFDILASEYNSSNQRLQTRYKKSWR